MKITELRELLKDKKVIEEINKHLWIESQKAGYSIGIERATDEWLRLHAEGWLKYNKPEKYKKLRSKSSSKRRKSKPKKKSSGRKRTKKKAAKKKTKKKATRKRRK